jgi:hypothetical protein
MKYLLICLIVLALPLVAEETSLGMVTGIKGNSLVLVDGLEISMPGGSMGRYIDENNQAVDASSITFPFTASLIFNTELPSHMRAQTTVVKIHKFYDVVNGRLVERKFR